MVQTLGAGQVSSSSRVVLDDEGDILFYEGSILDITDRIRAEQALKESEARFRDFAVSASDWLWETDAELRVTYVSEAFEENLGRPAEQSIGRKKEEIYAEIANDGTAEEIEIWRRHFEDLKARRPFRDFVYRWTTPEGEARYIRNSGKPVFDASGEFLGYRGMASNITEQVLSEERAGRATRLLDEAIDNLGETFVLWDADDRLVVCNERFREINRSVIEATRPGTRYEDFLRAAIAAGLLPEAVGREAEFLADRLHQHRHPGEPYEGARQDGRWLLNHSRRMPDGGTVTIATDITEQKRLEASLRESEERFRDFAGSSSDWFWETDAEHRITFVSGQMDRSVGGSLENVIGRTRWEVFGVDLDRDAGWRHFRDDMEAHRVIRDFQFTHRDGDGSHFYRSVSGTPVFDADGRFRGYRGTSTDLTPERLAERTLVERDRQLREAQRIGHIGHWYWTADDDRFEASEEFCSIFGFDTANDLASKAVIDIIHEEDQARIKDVHQAALGENRGYDFVYRIRRADGEVRSIEGSTEPVFDEDGAFIAYFGIVHDVTERKQVEEALSLTQFSVDHASEAIFWLGTDGGFEYINEAGLKLLGYAREELASMYIWDVDPAVARDDWPETWARLQSRGPHTFESSHRTKAGVEIPVEVSTFHIRFGGRRIVCSFSRDITERKRSEAALIRSEERFRNFAAAASDWFWEMDAERRYTYISDVVGDRFGHDQAWYIGKTHDEMVERLYERSEWQPFFEAFEARRPFRDLVAQRTEGGDRHWIRSSGAPVYGTDGAFKGFVGCASDITQTVLAEQVSERFLAAIENLSEGLAVFDPDDRLIACNHEYRQTFDADVDLMGPGISFEKILRESFKHYTYPEAADDREGWIAARLERRRNPSGPFEMVRSGRNLLIREELLPDGSTVHAMLDVTEQRQRDEQLGRAQKMEAIGQLTGGIAHDFNNLLAVIQGNIAYLDGKLGGESELKALTAPALRAVERGASLTQRLLAFSRLQALDIGAVDAGDLITELGELLRRSLGEEISTEIRIAPDLWPCEVDAGQLEQAIVNLANNARDAMPRGGKLTIEAANIALSELQAAQDLDLVPGEFVVIAATDTGAGMTAEVLEKVFDPFFTTKEVGKGTGLGLSMVYGFVKQSLGHVTVYSEPDKGTTFKLYLPRSHEPAAPCGPAKAEPIATTRGETILVVEDDTDLRTLAVMLLADLGYRVLEAASGRATLDLLEHESHIDLLLSDVVLPEGMGGKEVAAAVRRKIPSVKVLFMSGYAEGSIVHHGRIDADARLLQKPFDPDDLAREVRAAIDD